MPSNSYLARYSPHNAGFLVYWTNAGNRTGYLTVAKSIGDVLAFAGDRAVMIAPALDVSALSLGQRAAARRIPAT